MPIFQSREARTRQLIDQMELAMVEKAYNEFGSNLNMFPVDAWLSAGGSAAAEALVQAMKYKRPLASAWGSGDKFKALRLVRLFSLAMVSRYFWFLDEADSARSEEQRVDVRHRSGWAICNLCGEDETYSLGDFLNIDIQFRWDELRNADKSRSGVSVYEKSLLWDLALEMCGYSSGLDLRASRFPLQNYDDVWTAKREHGAAPEDILLLSAVLSACMQTIPNYLRRTRPI